jgi:sodium pump decarboxylase gamma subunit
MIIIGIKLTVWGMGLVLLFLVTLFLILLLSGKLLSSKSVAELISIEAEERKKQGKRISFAKGSVLISVISAAITAYRDKIQRR